MFFQYVSVVDMETFPNMGNAPGILPCQTYTYYKNIVIRPRKQEINFGTEKVFFWVARLVST